MHRWLRILGITLLASLAVAFAPNPARAQSDTREGQSMNDMIDVIDRAQVDQLWLKARAKMAEARMTKKELKKLHKSRKGVAPRAPGLGEEGDRALAEEGSTSNSGQPLSPLAPPPNVITNNKAGDAVNAGQAEQHVAIVGQYGVASWNDGQGFVTGSHLQGVAYTTNGGASWTDVGDPPIAGSTGGTITRWGGDPVVAYNKNTGDFYVTGLVTLAGSANGIGFVRASFPGGVFTWDTPRVIRNAPNATNFIDKEWFTCDPGNGNIYCSYTDFNATNWIAIQRSTDNGVTWSAPLQVSDASDNGRVQASRPEVDNFGRLYVVYAALIPSNPLDAHRIKRSTDGGLTFGAASTPVTFIPVFNDGAPGFNRLRTIDNPAMYIDRSSGPNAGRVYITWHESIDVFNDPLFTLPATIEAENNNFFASANPFTQGTAIRGSLATGGADVFSFSATAGKTYIMQCDSLSAMFYQMQIWCSDTTTLLNRSGDNSSPPGGLGSVIWTAPASGTYYLRMVTITGGTNGGYRIRTGENSVPSANDRSRDLRDVFVTYSDDGSSWSTPARVNDDPVGYDDWLPEISVSTEGYVYAMWYDWRDAAPQCGGRSHIYATRSTDGGATWSANKQISSAQTNWTTAASNIAPNQGDYNGMMALDVVAYYWGDGRLGDVDAWIAVHQTGLHAQCPPNPGPAFPGDPVLITFGVNNPNVVFDGDFDYQITSQRTWPGFSMNGSGAMPAGATVPVNASFNVPDSAAAGTNEICFFASLPNGQRRDSCCVTLEILDRPTAALASLVSARAEGGRAEIEWSVSTSDPVNVYRSTDGTAWDFMTALRPDAQGRVRYTDATISGARRYGYRLGLRDAGQEIPAGEVWLDVSQVTALKFLGSRPNPVRGPFSLSFALPNAGRATLDLIDLSGRRVLHREVGQLGVGVHVITFDRTATLPAGIYTVRITQGPRTVTGKVSIIR